MSNFVYIDSIRTCGNMKRSLIERKVAWSFRRYVGYVLTEDVLVSLVKEAAARASNLKIEHPHCYECFLLYLRPATLKIGRHSWVVIKAVKGVVTDHIKLNP